MTSKSSYKNKRLDYAKANFDRPFYKHFVIELETSFDQANSLEWTEDRVEELFRAINTKVVKKISHLFKPQGISLVYIISSSHIAVHTWPENNFIHIDFITCDETQDFKDFHLIIARVFPGQKNKIIELSY